MRPLSSLLLLLALLAACVATLAGFGWWDTQDPYILGWIGASIALCVLEAVVDRVDR